MQTHYGIYSKSDPSSHRLMAVAAGTSSASVQQCRRLSQPANIRSSARTFTGVDFWQATPQTKGVTWRQPIRK